MKMSKPKIKLEIFDGWEDVEEIIKAYFIFLKSFELSWLESIIMKAFWH